jgi:hypothetical protein
MKGIAIIDFDSVKFVNFEAEINCPEEEGTIQVETFGIHMNVDGSIIYGLKIDAIEDSTAEKVTQKK